MILEAAMQHWWGTKKKKKEFEDIDEVIDLFKSGVGEEKSCIDYCKLN